MDHLDPKSWLNLAKGLEVGQSRRYDHDCGGGRTLKVAHTTKGFDAFCWRCNLSGFHAGPQESWQQRVARLATEKAVDEQVRSSLELPTPKVIQPSEWPLAARVWLYKAGFDNEQIRKHGFYYHPPTRRVVLPVYSGQASYRVLYWQARGFDPAMAKYLNPKVGDRPLAKYQPSTILDQAVPLVLTEDLLSAARVADAGIPAWSLLGTALTPKALSEVIAFGRPVRVWLDPDEAGVKGGRKIVPTIRAFGVDCSVVRSDKDPKYFSEKEIICHLS